MESIRVLQTEIEDSASLIIGEESKIVRKDSLNKASEAFHSTLTKLHPAEAEEAGSINTQLGLLFKLADELREKIDSNSIDRDAKLQKLRLDMTACQE